MNTIISFVFGLLLGCGMGIMIMGVLSLESRTDEMDSYKEIIQRQNDTINRQREIIDDFRYGMEDDIK